jgi:toxin ParE1/3/4
MGRVRPEIKEGYYSFPVEKHVVFYLILENYIAIIGILHGKMDIDKNLIH